MDILPNWHICCPKVNGNRWRLWNRIEFQGSNEMELTGSLVPKASSKNLYWLVPGTILVNMKWNGKGRKVRLCAKAMASWRERFFWSEIRISSSCEQSKMRVWAESSAVRSSATTQSSWWALMGPSLIIRRIWFFWIGSLEDYKQFNLNKVDLYPVDNSSCLFHFLWLSLHWYFVTE